MEDLLIELLSDNFGYPVYRQGSIPQGSKYPEHFFTFWNNDSEGYLYLDNEEQGIVYYYYLYFYSTDPNKTYNTLYEAKTVLKDNGFICSGAGKDVVSDEATHTGKEIDLIYIKTKNN